MLKAGIVSEPSANGIYKLKSVLNWPPFHKRIFPVDTLYVSYSPLYFIPLLSIHSSKLLKSAPSSAIHSGILLVVYSSLYLYLLFAYGE